MSDLKNDSARSNITIRKFSPGDRQAVRDICCDTAYFGEPCEHFFPDREFLADIIMNYYTDFEPQHTWVAEENGKIVGYLSSCFNEGALSMAMFFKILPTALIRALSRKEIFNRKTKDLLFYNFKAFISKDTALAGMDKKKFPAQIHQNIKKGFRGKGIGKSLIKALLKELDVEGVPGVRFKALRQEPSFSFFEKQGFQLFDCKRAERWEEWLKRTPLYFMEYGKKYDFEAEDIKNELFARP